MTGEVNIKRIEELRKRIELRKSEELEKGQRYNPLTEINPADILDCVNPDYTEQVRRICFEVYNQDIEKTLDLLAVTGFYEDPSEALKMIAKLWPKNRRNCRSFYEGQKSAYEKRNKNGIRHKLLYLECALDTAPSIPLLGGPTLCPEGSTSRAGNSWDNSVRAVEGE